MKHLKKIKFKISKLAKKHSIEKEISKMTGGSKGASQTASKGSSKSSGAQNRGSSGIKVGATSGSTAKKTSMSPGALSRIQKADNHLNSPTHLSGFLERAQRAAPTEAKK